MPSQKTADAWKNEGDALVQAKKYSKAIDCYDQALRRIDHQNDAIPLLLSRCEARILSQHFDAAVKDAGAVRSLSPKNREAIILGIRCLYALRRFLECNRQLEILFKASLGDNEAATFRLRCEDRLREESEARYDFGSMLDESVIKSPKPDMDRGDFVGPIGVRECKPKSRGRGYFATREIKAGELLLVEKAFSAIYTTEEEAGASLDEKSGLRTRESLDQLRTRLTDSTFAKIARNNSLAPSFQTLFPGPDIVEEIDDRTGRPFLNRAFVENRLLYNAFAFGVVSKNFDWRAKRHQIAADNKPFEETGAMGVWINASLINHSCHPNVRRSFIGDLIILRAERDIAPGEELGFSYIPCLDTYKARQELLKAYGFTCTCSICECERATPTSTIQRRSDLVKGMAHQLDSPSSGASFSGFLALLTRIQETYVTNPVDEPRLRVIDPILNLLEAALAARQVLAVLHLGFTLLFSLGFDVEISHVAISKKGPVTNDEPSSAILWHISRWGRVCDEIIESLRLMKWACRLAQPTCCDGLDADARTAYCILAGESHSYEARYGGDVEPELQEGHTTVLGHDWEGLDIFMRRVKTQIHL